MPNIKRASHSGYSIAFVILLAAIFSVAQNSRYDAPFPSISATTQTPFLVANTPPNSPVLAVCHSPANATPCTNYATTYNSAGAACSNGAQDTPQPQPSACQQTGDAQGNIGFWAPAGTYDYTVCVNNQCSGPYTVTLGGSGGTTSPLTTKGDIYTFSSINDRLPVGANGLCLKSDSTQSTGLNWQACASGGSPVGPTGIAQYNNGGSFGGMFTAALPNSVLFVPSTGALSVSNFNSIRYVTSDYSWSQAPAGSVGIGANTVSLTPCPAGILASYGFTSTPWTEVLVSGAPGAAETPVITATTCTQAGGANGTITFTAANAHNAGFTLGSASAGFQETLNASMQTVVDSTILQTGVTIQVPGDRTWQGRATVMSNGADIYFSGPTTCSMSDTCLFVGDSASSTRVSNVRIHNFAPRAGVVNGNFAALEVNAQHTHVYDMTPERSLTANVSFGSFITVDDDQAFELDGMSNPQSGSWSHCGTDFCTVLIKTGTGSAVGHLSHINFTGACIANGIDWSSGNTLQINDSVIQAYAQFAERAHGGFTNISAVTLDNVYHEVANCAQLNPLGIGITGLVADGTANVRGGVGPLGALQRFANTGGTQYNYYVVVHGNVHGVSAPFLAGMALTNGAGNITVKWLQIGEDATITYDVIRTSGSANNPAPYTANCGGGTPTTCGSVALALTTGAACAAVGSTNICSFVDAAANNTVAYTVTTSAPYWPALYSNTNSGTWPGGTVYSQPHDSVGVSAPTHALTFDTCCDSTANSQVNPVSQMVSQFGPEIPVFVANSCSAVSGGYMIVCLNNLNSTSNGPTMLRSASYNGVDPASSKGRLIFEQARNSIERMDLITLVDVNWAKTLATTGLRPTFDAGDMAIGQDASGATPAANNVLYFRSANNVRSYINVLPNGSAWLEDLSSSLKTLKVPLQFNGSTSGSAQIGVAAVAGTPNAINLPTATGGANALLATNGANPQQTSWTLTPSLTSLTLGGGTAVSLIKFATDVPGAITVNAQTCTDRGVAIAGSSATATIQISAAYALDANIIVAPAQSVAGTAHYRLCNPTGANITLNAAAAFNISVIQ